MSLELGGWFATEFDEVDSHGDLVDHEHSAGAVAAARSFMQDRLREHKVGVDANAPFREMCCLLCGVGGEHGGAETQARLKEALGRLENDEADDDDCDRILRAHVVSDKNVASAQEGFERRLAAAVKKAEEASARSAGDDEQRDADEAVRVAQQQLGRICAFQSTGEWGGSRAQARSAARRVGARPRLHSAPAGAAGARQLMQGARAKR